MPVDKSFVRCVFAHVVAADRREDVATVASRLWPRDAAVRDLVTRGATTPSSTTTMSTFAAIATGSFLSSLLPAAGASLINAAPRFDLTAITRLNLPRASSTGTAQFIAEGAPIVAGQGSLLTVPLTLAKLAIIEALSREVAEYSAEDGQTVVEMILRDAVARGLDVALFGNAAGTASNPPGLLNGITSTTASTLTDPFGAALADSRALVDACVAGGGGRRIMFFCSPGRALSLSTYLEGDAEVFGSSSIPAGQLIAVDSAAFASGYGAVPSIEASLSMAIHFEDTTPLQIGTPGSPPIVAAPTRSAFQSDLIVLKCRLDCSWVMRTPAVAFISSGMLW
jgi:hypothetical protein